MAGGMKLTGRRGRRPRLPEASLRFGTGTGCADDADAGADRHFGSSTGSILRGGRKEEILRFPFS